MSNNEQDNQHVNREKTLLECDISISKKHQNTLIIEPHTSHSNEGLERLKQQILKSTLALDWLYEKDLELVFCMFGCTPYIRSKLEQDEHFETVCKGNPQATKRRGSNADV